MFITIPFLFNLMLGKIVLIICIGPNRLVSKFFFISSIGTSSIGPVIPTPALLIKISIATTFFNSF